MKTIIIPDVHGRTTWEKIIEQEKDFNKVIFVGDYFDSFDINPYKQMNNFNKILDFYKSLPNDVTLLCGNHDFHYIDINGISKCSGWNETTNRLCSRILTDLFNSRVLKMTHVVDNYLISHAGVSKTFLKNYDIELDDMNNLFFHKPKVFNFSYNNHFSANGYGDNVWQSPIWIRPFSLRQDSVEDFVQIVGHTGCEKIELIQNVVQIDTFSNEIVEYVTIVDGEICINTLNK